MNCQISTFFQIVDVDETAEVSARSGDDGDGEQQELKSDEERAASACPSQADGSGESQPEGKHLHSTPPSKDKSNCGQKLQLGLQAV